MTRRIIVSSNCQTAGIARTLQALVRNASITAVPLHEIPEDAEAARQYISQYDTWVTIGRAEIFDGPMRSPEIVKCPRLVFHSFHPDIAFVRNDASGSPLVYNSSRIIAWAYAAGLDREKTATLFASDVFRALSYFNLWTMEVEALTEYYRSHFDIDFYPFYLSLKRSGVFMHDYEHPTAFALVKLGKLVAQKLGASAEALAATLTVPDPWAHIAWPVYPEIADEFGLVGSYTWSELSSVADGLRGFIDHSFRRYESDGLRRDRVSVMTDGGYRPVRTLYDDTLMPFV